MATVYYGLMKMDEAGRLGVTPVMRMKGVSRVDWDAVRKALPIRYRHHNVDDNLRLANMVRPEYIGVSLVA